MVEYSGNSYIEGEDLKKYGAISSEPANILAIEYAGTEVFSNSNNKALGKEEETGEEKYFGRRNRRKSKGETLQNDISALCQFYNLQHKSGVELSVA